MARVIFTASASKDQAAILSDLHAKAGLRTATKYRALFVKLYDLLADHPAKGARRPALGPQVRIGIVLPSYRNPRGQLKRRHCDYPSHRPWPSQHNCRVADGALLT
jgi:plasmid stabilization system protein ParE